MGYSIPNPLDLWKEKENLRDYATLKGEGPFSWVVHVG
jgi:hypothetical protein